MGLFNAGTNEKTPWPVGRYSVLAKYSGLRRARIAEISQETLSQGALLTREDLAYRVFFVSARTISRDLKVLREDDVGIPLPLRSTVHDVAPVLTHRVRIVRLASASRPPLSSRPSIGWKAKNRRPEGKARGTVWNPANHRAVGHMSTSEGRRWRHETFAPPPADRRPETSLRSPDSQGLLFHRILPRQTVTAD